uniref:Uncharacterized protein n=1 Tax=Glossina palpalis gambiensis TaxID=67801 RepID=A0A1B0BNI1_9MUSC
MGRDATPYLERNRVGRDAIDSAAALTDMGKYLFRERRLPVYDIAVAITKYDMCRRRKGGRCTKGTADEGYVPVKETTTNVGVEFLLTLEISKSNYANSKESPYV